MRSKVASQSNGHAFEKRFLDLDPIQLSILYRQARKEENEQKKEKYELIKLMNESWTKKLNDLFSGLQFFTNPELYKRVEEYKKLKVEQEEISPENFAEEWEKMLEVIPDEFIVENDTSSGLLNIPEIDEEMDKMIAGWVSKTAYLREEGESNGNG